MPLATLAVFALVAQDPVAMRASPSEAAPVQEMLTQGDAVEVRAARLDYLEVYDHERERAGFVRAAQLRPIGFAEADAPGLLAVVRFLRDSAGAESLGIAYVAAYLRAAPAKSIDAEAFDALGQMAERLAQRASLHAGPDARTAAQIEAVAHYGVTLRSIEIQGRSVRCYDGDAFRRVLMLPASAEQRAHAVLALTRQDCIDPRLLGQERLNYDKERAELLMHLDTTELGAMLRNRVQLRSAGVWASVAYERARWGGDAHDAAERALGALAGIDKIELARQDRALYSEAAVRVAASRWAGVALSRPDGYGLHITTQAGEEGATCVLLLDSQHDPLHALLRRCTFGQVWPASASVNIAGTALALSVQQLEGWSELWLFRHEAGGWNVAVLPPAISDPELGYIEFAGWVPQGAAATQRFLAVREARAGGRWLRSFEVIDLQTLDTEHRAASPTLLPAFKRWQSAQWKAATVSLR